jgi:hypothetical protein
VLEMHIASERLASLALRWLARRLAPHFGTTPARAVR